MQYHNYLSSSSIARQVFDYALYSYAHGGNVDMRIGSEQSAIVERTKMECGAFGCFLSVDPLAHKYTGWTPYHFTMNSPIQYVDPDGRNVESTHTDENGNIIAEYDDGDDGVYVHYNTSSIDVLDNYSSDNTSAGGHYIGDLGGELDVSEVFQNVLNNNGSEAEGHFGKSISPLLDWANKVKGGGDWDLKGNTSTVFGAAWAHDHKVENKGKPKTKFIFGDKFSGNAADFGNYHAGYTGTKAGIPMYMQKVGAGVIEQIKMKNWKAFVPQNYVDGPGNFLTAPHHDRQKDYEYNTKGMKDAASGM